MSIKSSTMYGTLLSMSMSTMGEYRYQRVEKVGVAAITYLNMYLTTEDETMNLEDAVIGLKAYKEVDQRAQKLWHDIDQAILGPRMNIASDDLPGISIHEVSKH